MAAVEITVDEEQLQGLFQSDRPLARLLEEICNQVLEAEISDHLGADPHERTETRSGWRNGHYERCLTTRVGTLELRVPRSRDGSFSTELFERYQRIRDRRGSVLVPVENETCGGCHSRIPAQRINEIREGDKVHYCEFCNRMLYWHEDLNGSSSDE
jgi:hypothetical protein